jgi:hypothetical protein
MMNNFRENLVRILAIADAGRKATTGLVILPLPRACLRRRCVLKPSGVKAPRVGGGSGTEALKVEAGAAAPKRL